MCADSINENMHVQDTCDTGEESRRESAEAARDKDTWSKLSECEHMCDEQERAQSSAHKNLEGCVYAERIVAEIVKTNASESEESVPIRERVLVVEKEGCATVVMYPERHTAHVFLADGTVITGNNKGSYQVKKLDC